MNQLFIYHQLVKDIKSVNKMLAKRKGERGRLTVADATNTHAAVSFWEGQLAVLDQYKNYFDQQRGKKK